MEDKIFIDFSKEKKVSTIKEKARQAVINDMLEYLAKRYDMTGLTASNEIAVVVGQAPDEDGFASDVVVTVKTTCRPWYNKSDDLKRPVTKFDFDEETEAYRMEVEAKKAPKK